MHDTRAPLAERVLQEARDPENPLAERLRFIAIYSSILDEFFRVRVAYLRGLARLPERRQDELVPDPPSLHARILEIVARQQEMLGGILRGPILQEIEVLGIHWPATDVRQVFRDVAVDRFLAVTEGEDRLEELELPSFRFQVPR